MKDFNYAQTQAELDTIVARLQSADVNVQEAVELHAEGQKLVKKLEAYLDSVQLKITKEV